MAQRREEIQTQINQEKCNIKTIQKEEFASPGQAGTFGVDPEFLSALPMDIQEEVSNTF